MSAAPPTRHRKRWSLRLRLVLSIVGLLAAASLVVGVVSVVSLQGFLMDRLDQQLSAATGRSQDAVGGNPGDAPVPAFPGSATLPRVGVQGPLTVTAVILDSRILAGVVNAEGNLELLTEEQTRTLASVDPTGEPVTVALDGELGDYRVAANRVGDNLTVITGLPLSEVQAVLLQLIGVIAIVTAVAVAAAIVAGILIVRRALRPLERVASTASLVTELPLDRGEVALSVRVAEPDADPSTEVGQVGAAINRMLGHVASALSARQASENKVRQFVADASHELRTPLASIRGYAELTRRGHHDLPADVAQAIGRVESESIRMTTLVEELLLLARLDEGRELEQQPVDLSRILIDAVGDARAAAPDHEFSLEVPAEPVTVLGDASRLHQAVANLLGNAGVHTPAGTAVTVSLSRPDASTAVMTVADNGPGFSPELAARLFERFTRGDPSRSRAAGGSGLGLAIVSAIVTRHGGSVAARSADGETFFEVRLPANAE